ncbi:patatin-like phospholipase family protein [Bradyrhizobium sp. BWC-3-1]|uniref:patatin-like phospholipase family protein n=1 Tax=Bradyrhizobium sp. BWC-3-1 TaxID=3080012 RepID=UPI00293EAF7C|nr:patatin-like phospholipase family protein [Bradyrhizobium sp. BWC-3-1]WOH58526.1 patatin-like phospholipase family protein [Bradyrhizobium sp. BWC-3-1]
MAEPTENKDITLCLSGGGLRATYFHLGVIWAFRRQGLLEKLERVYSVSGGSIAAAHLALNWRKYAGSSDRDAIAAAQTLMNFAKRDVRGRVVRRAVLAFLCFVPLVNAVLWFFGKRIPVGRTDFLEAEYKGLFGNAELSSLKVEGGPEFFLLGTTFLTGDACIFSSDGYARGANPPYGGQELPVAKAVAASSAFPPLFPPARILASDIGADRADLFGFNEDLVTDGGVFDNLGYDVLQATRGQVYISDAGARFDLPPNRWFWNIISRTSRTTDILMKRTGDKTLLTIKNKPGVKSIQIGKRGAQGGLLTLEAEASAARIRTDLDKFNAFEVSALVLNGFRNALQILVPGPTPAVSLQPIPFLPVHQVANEKITKSSKRSYWPFRLLDWASYALLAYAALVCWLVYHEVYAQYLVLQQNKLLASQAPILERDLFNSRKEVSRLAEEGNKLRAQVSPQASACLPVTLLRTLDLSDVPTLDGEGNTVGIISAIKLSILQTCDASGRSDKYIMQYGYYNGSGTWRGSQNATITFLGENGALLKTTEPFPIDRSRCIYQRPETRTKEGPLDNVGTLVTSARIDVSRVQGTQTRC